MLRVDPRLSSVFLSSTIVCVTPHVLCHRGVTTSALVCLRSTTENCDIAEHATMAWKDDNVKLSIFDTIKLSKLDNIKLSLRSCQVEPRYQREISSTEQQMTQATPEMKRRFERFLGTSGTSDEDKLSVDPVTQ